jgi:hypothetical protein
MAQRWTGHAERKASKKQKIMELKMGKWQQIGIWQLKI